MRNRLRSECCRGGRAGWIPAHLTNDVDYSWIAGMLVAGLLYLVLSRSLDRGAEQSAIEASERRLQAIDAEVSADFTRGPSA